MLKEALTYQAIQDNKTSQNGHLASYSENIQLSEHNVVVEEQNSSIIEKDNGVYVRFYGELSSDMKLFIEREESYNKKMKEQQAQWEKDKNDSRRRLVPFVEEILIGNNGEMRALEPNQDLELTPRRAIPFQ